MKRQLLTNRKIDSAIDATADEISEALTCDLPIAGRGCGRIGPRGYACTRSFLHLSDVHVASGVDRPDGTPIFDIWRAEND